MGSCAATNVSQSGSSLKEAFKNTFKKKLDPFMASKLLESRLIILQFRFRQLRNHCILMRLTVTFKLQFMITEDDGG